MPLRGGWGVGRLMANAILNFHFDYLNPSLTEMTTAAMTVRRRRGVEAMMVVPTNLEGIAVNMIMARVGWNTNLCRELKGSGEEDKTSLQ